MSNGTYGEVTNGELARRMDEMKDSVEALHNELTEGHQRLRHDYANVKSVADGALTIATQQGERIKRVEAMQDKMVWSVIGAYGAILLAVLAVLISKAVG